MLAFVDNFLNRVTMYKAILYYVSGLWAAAFVLSFFKVLPFSSLELLVSTFLIVGISFVANFIFARVFGAPSNIESVYTTALIMVLIVPPAHTDGYLGFIIWAAVLAMASKYIIAINKKHLFNPAAIAVVLTAFGIGHSAIWWVNSVYLLPLVLVGGILVVRKIRRFDLVASFIIAALLNISITAFLRDGDILSALQKTLTHSALLFLAFAMLTEPATTPPTRGLRIIYGAMVGFLFNPAIHIGSLYFTPELALVAGNIFSYLVSPKQKLILRLKEKVLSATDVYDFWFDTDKQMPFQPGQYLEWTLGHEHQDMRGMRRYFTIASSPTERGIMAGIKFYPNSSTFKRSMMFLNPGDTLVASQLAGDFVMPKDPTKKLVFMAGGIGVTPFRSMIKYLLDKKEKRDITFFYSNYGVADIAYKDLFDQAQKELGIKVVYTITSQPIPADWTGQTGYVDEAMIRREVPDFARRMFYISGSRGMVLGFSQTLAKMSVSKRNIKTDFFPGFA